MHIKHIPKNLYICYRKFNLMVDIFQLAGTVGLILITLGILIKDRKSQNILYVLGGLSLGSYSLSVKNAIFIALQTIFTLAAIYNLARIQFFDK